MANLIIQENGVARTTPALHGEEITIQTPCDCSAVTGVQIAGVAYPFYDAAGKPLATGSGLFSKGNLIRVLIDTVNTRATIINHAITPSGIGAAVTTTYITSVPTGWTADESYFYKDVTVNGILATDNPIVDVQFGSDNAANVLYNESICKVFRITTSANSIRLWATEDIAQAFPIQLKVVR